jgi:hypothetical protein
MAAGSVRRRLTTEAQRTQRKVKSKKAKVKGENALGATAYAFAFGLCLLCVLRVSVVKP